MDGPVILLEADLRKVDGGVGVYGGGGTPSPPGFYSLIHLQLSEDIKYTKGNLTIESQHEHRRYSVNHCMYNVHNRYQKLCRSLGFQLIFTQGALLFSPECFLM